MKIIQYKFNRYTKSISWSLENEEIAKREATNGEYFIKDINDEEAKNLGFQVNSKPTQLDIIEAQITYTAMMTDTLMEV